MKGSNHSLRLFTATCRHGGEYFRFVNPDLDGLSLAPYPDFSFIIPLFESSRGSSAERNIFPPAGSYSCSIKRAIRHRKCEFQPDYYGITEHVLLCGSFKSADLKSLCLHSDFSFLPIWPGPSWNQSCTEVDKPKKQTGISRFPLLLWSGVRPAGRLCCFGFQLWWVWLTQGDGPMYLSIRGRQRILIVATQPVQAVMRYSHFAHFLLPPPNPKLLREAVDGPLRSFHHPATQASIYNTEL